MCSQERFGGLAAVSRALKPVFLHNHQFSSTLTIDHDDVEQEFDPSCLTSYLLPHLPREKRLGRQIIALPSDQCPQLLKRVKSMMAVLPTLLLIPLYPQNRPSMRMEMERKEKLLFHSKPRKRSLRRQPMSSRSPNFRQESLHLEEEELTKSQ